MIRPKLPLKIPPKEHLCEEGVAVVSTEIPANARWHDTDDEFGGAYFSCWVCRSTFFVPHWAVSEILRADQGEKASGSKPE